MSVTTPRLKILEFARLDASANMALDRRLLDLCEARPEEAFLRFYTWTRPSLSLGHNEPEAVIDADRARVEGVDIVHRPTGGRVVLHGDDLTYAVVLPKGIGRSLQATYKLISQALVDGLAAAGLHTELQRGTTGKSQAAQKPCFASVSRYEVTYKGRKVVGSAQRVGNCAILQHGSIPLGRGYLRIVDYMRLSEPVRKKLRVEIEATTACLNDVAGRTLDPRALSEGLTTAFVDRLGCPVQPLAIDAIVY